MEIRNAKVIVSTAGGTAGKTSKTYKLSLPSSWLAEIGISVDEKDIPSALLRPARSRSHS